MSSGELIDGDEIGTFSTGHIVQLNGKAMRKRKRPIGFAPPSPRSRKKPMSGGRPAGTFPDVPRFDVP